MKRSNRVACIVNEDAFASKDGLHRHLDRIRGECSVFIGHGNSADTSSLCVDADVRYEDFEFVVLLNPMGRRAFEHSINLFQRQDYYLNSLVGSVDRVRKMVDLLDRNAYEGLLMPSRDFFKAYYLRYYEQWSGYSGEVKADFARNGIEFCFPLDDEPLRLENNCAMFRTAALRGFSDMRLQRASQEKLAFLLPLFVQHNGFLPTYCDDPRLVANGMLGREYFEKKFPLR